MRWVRDRTGRFRQRPHYEAAELDRELGDLVAEFLRKRYGAARYPISTDDLTVLVERHASLDPYADLSPEGPDVEGVTYFDVPGRPLIRIDSSLSTSERRSNRYRTTLTHELTHVRIHSFLWTLEGAPPLSLWGGSAEANSGPRCKRETIIDRRGVDWMEWQAAYGCGALLMPALAVHEVASDVGADPPVAEDGVDAHVLMSRVMETFAVSADAARVRLLKLGYLRPATAQPLAL